MTLLSKLDKVAQHRQSCNAACRFCVKPAHTSPLEMHEVTSRYVSVQRDYFHWYAYTYVTADIIVKVLFEKRGFVQDRRDELVLRSRGFKDAWL